MKLFLQIYYSFLFIVIYQRGYWFINSVSDLGPDYIFFAKPLGFFNLPVEIRSVIFLLTLFFLCFAIFKPQRILRILTSLLVLILFSILYSYGKINPSSHAFILSSVLVCFFNENRGLNSKQNFFILRLIQGVLLSHYFMSGLWKLREMISTRFEFSLSEIVTEYIAYKYFDQNMHFLLKLLLYEQAWLLGFGYFCVLLFQLSALTPILLNRYFKLYGVLALLFHFSTGIFFSVYFSPTVLAALFFFIIAESMRECKI